MFIFSTKEPLSLDFVTEIQLNPRENWRLIGFSNSSSQFLTGLLSQNSGSVKKIAYGLTIAILSEQDGLINQIALP